MDSRYHLQLAEFLFVIFLLKRLDNLMIVYLVRLDVVQWPEHLDLLCEFLIFGDRRHDRRVVFLVAHDDVGDQWALRWEESCTAL